MNMNQKGFVNIIIIVIVVVLVGAGAYFVLNRQSQLTPTPTPTPTSGALISGPITVKGEITCLPKKGSGPQTLECAIGLKGLDGQYYGLKNLFKLDPEYKFSQAGLQVEVSGVFSPKEMLGPDGNKYDVVGNIDVTSIKEVTSGSTPPPTVDGEVQISLKEGQRESSFLLEKIYPDRITGLNFREYPVPRDQGYPVTLRIGEVVSNGCTITLTLIRIEGNIAIFARKTDFNRICPICLAGNTLIDTPSGLVLVKDLQVGMSVWTTDKIGQRVFAVVTKTSKVPVPPTHQMVHLVLNDGRELFVSPRHPTVDGRTVGDLVAGDLYNDASVVSAERVPYRESATYDILPSGGTGFYWANGILVGSTLR